MISSCVGHEAAKLAGVPGYSDSELEENLAIHSRILVALAEGGLIGGVFFIFYGMMLLGALILPTARHGACRIRRAGFICSSSCFRFGTCYSALSPGSHRIGIAIGWGLIVLLWCEWRTRFAAALGRHDLEWPQIPLPASCTCQLVMNSTAEFLLSQNRVSRPAFRKRPPAFTCH